MWPSDQTTPAEIRPAPAKAAAPRITARATQPPVDAPAPAADSTPTQPTGDTRAPERLRSLPTWLLSQAAAAGAKLVDEALAADALRKQDYRVLVALDEAGTASQADLGRSVWLDRSDLHGIVTTLESRGFIQRRRDPDDKRRNIVELTPAGQQSLAELNGRVDAAQAQLLASLDSADQERLTQLLGRVMFGEQGDAV